jgi:hypothetical protein
VIDGAARPVGPAGVALRSAQGRSRRHAWWLPAARAAPPRSSAGIDGAARAGLVGEGVGGLSTWCSRGEGRRRLIRATCPRDEQREVPVVGETRRRLRARAGGAGAGGGGWGGEGRWLGRYIVRSDFREANSFR